MIRAIDVHSHPSDKASRRRLGEWAEQSERYFRQPRKDISLDEQADMYRRRRMLAVVFGLDEETTTGRPPESNDAVSAAVDRNNDVLIGFGSVDPHKGKVAVREVHRCVEELGLRGMKFMPLTQEFFVDDPAVRPVFEACAELSVPALIHSGTTGIGAGTPGGMGIKLKFGKPIPHLDDLAAELPDLTIIAAHPGWPWHEELIGIMWHKTNVFMDLSGWAPKYLPSSVIQNADSLLSDRVLFGSDFPMLHPDRWLSEFQELPLKRQSKEKILLTNAAALLGVDLDRTRPEHAIHYRP